MARSHAVSARLRIDSESRPWVSTLKLICTLSILSRWTRHFWSDLHPQQNLILWCPICSKSRNIQKARPSILGKSRLRFIDTFFSLRYGFLSENADFVELLESKDLTFVGPPASAIRKMGSKSESKKIMEQAGVPILQGYHGDEQSPEFLLQKSREIGFPVMLKASLGGGGKGMRIVHNEDEFME